jgi:GH24 family phage-related lysozyme (muramidase)
MDMNEEERKQNPPFLVTKENNTQDIDILKSKEILEQNEISPLYYKDDIEPLIIDVYDDLLKDEGESGDTTGAAETLKRGLTVETKNFIEKIASDSKGYKVNYSDKEASEEYINYLNFELEKLEGYKTLPYDVKRALLKEFYNIGHTAITNNKQYSKLKQTIKNSKQGKDVDKIFYELLDTASIGGKASKGLAKRRAETYNKFATEKITHVNQLENGTLQYLSDDKIVFEYTPRGGKHSTSKVGKLTI